MRRTALYSRSSRTVDPGPAALARALAQQENATPENDETKQAARPGLFRRALEGFRRRRPPGKPAILTFLTFTLMLGLIFAMRPSQYRLTQKDIDKAVMNTLENTTLPHPAVAAYETIRPSVVRVAGYMKGKETTDGKVEEVQRGVGTGVVIVDTGIILTNLHVVHGSDIVKVTFFDGLESDAKVIGVKPEQDLAVLQAQTIPDDLIPAVMRSSDDLSPGDHVFAVGFPFGIGPSISAGVVSGLKRQFMSPEGKRMLSNLIQFDAAANPGNSGGPLINSEGEVVGIVTAILNPTEQRVFIGIGFAVPIESAASAAGLPPF